MRLLRIVCSGHPLFKESETIDFVASQRVTDEDRDQMTHLFSNIYQNNVIALIGINASGKTIALNIVSFVLNLLSANQINNTDVRDVLSVMNNEDRLKLEVFFYDDGNVNDLSVEIGVDKSSKERRYVILNENLKSKSAKKVKYKKSLFDFTKYDSEVKRDNDEAYLRDDISIMIAYNKEHSCRVDYKDLSDITDDNRLEVEAAFPTSLLKMLDPGVEYLRYERKGLKKDIRLKFCRHKEEIILSNERELNLYLSSGTIKGLTVYMVAADIFKSGGVLLIDEMENHFNRELVAVLIRFFQNTRINKNGAILLFSTHYPSLLDEFDRNDNTYIIRNEDGITVENLASRFTRNDIKKSVAYESNYLNGTAPSYEAVMDYKRFLREEIQ